MPNRIKSKAGGRGNMERGREQRGGKAKKKRQKEEKKETKRNKKREMTTYGKEFCSTRCQHPSRLITAASRETSKLLRAPPPPVPALHPPPSSTHRAARTIFRRRSHKSRPHGFPGSIQDPHDRGGGAGGRAFMVCLSYGLSTTAGNFSSTSQRPGERSARTSRRIAPEASSC